MNHSQTVEEEKFIMSYIIIQKDDEKTGLKPLLLLALSQSERKSGA